MLNRVKRVVVPVLMVVGVWLGLGGGPAGQSPSNFVTRIGTTLFVDGHPYRYTGINAYELSTYWAVNPGCGQQVNDLDGFFSSLRPNSMVTFSGMHTMAWNQKTHVADFTAIDRVVQAAERHGQKLTISLSGQSGLCDDGHWHDKAWYDGGYRQAFNEDGLNPALTSYWDYIHKIVPRYKDSAAVAIWQPVLEPEASDCPSQYRTDGCYTHQVCPSLTGAATSLRNFFDTVGAEIMTMDPNHLVDTATISARQCGLTGQGYALLAASPYIDIMEYHDYGQDDTPLPSGFTFAINAAHVANKVLVAGEAGIKAGTACAAPTKRAAQFRAKIEAEFKAGVSGYTPWIWVSRLVDSCSFDIAPDDPIMDLLRTYRVPA